MSRKGQLGNQLAFFCLGSSQGSWETSWPFLLQEFPSYVLIFFRC